MRFFTPRRKKFKAKLADGRKVELELRPYTIADLGWHQDNFPGEAIKLAIEGVNINTLCRIIWHQMTPESRDIFFRIKYQRWDENTGELLDADPEGWERFCEAVLDLESVAAGVNALCDCMMENGFIDSGAEKKKTR